jgi:succinyl-CoA synthetase beta subunit
VTEAEVREAIEGLKLARLLKGFRGQPALDDAALVDTVLRLGRFFLDHRDTLVDIEINPLIVRPQGAGAVAVDVRTVFVSDAPAAGGATRET